MSLTGHHMPHRTTQQSHRPRVSDRTMVGTLPPRCLQALPHGTKNAATYGPGSGATPRSTTEPHTGLDVRHLPSPSPCGRGEVFSLDIPFYRTRQFLSRRDKAGGSRQMIWNSLLIKITYTGNPSEETYIVQEIEHPQGMPASYLRFVGEQRPAGEHMRHL